MELKNYFAQDSQGNIIPGATCYLYQPNTSTLVTGLKDAAGNPMPNPFTGAANGLIQFAAPGGLYDLRVSSGMRQFSLRVQFSDLDGFKNKLVESTDPLVNTKAIRHTRADGATVPLAGALETLFSVDVWVTPQTDLRTLIENIRSAATKSSPNNSRSQGSITPSRIRLAPGKYNVNADILIDFDGLQLIGAGPHQTEIYFTGNSKFQIGVDAATQADCRNVKGLKIEGVSFSSGPNNNPTFADGFPCGVLDVRMLSWSSMDGVYIKNHSGLKNTGGMYLSGYQWVDFNQVHIDGFGRYSLCLDSQSPETWEVLAHFKSCQFILGSADESNISSSVMLRQSGRFRTSSFSALGVQFDNCQMAFYPANNDYTRQTRAVYAVPGLSGSDISMSFNECLFENQQKFFDVSVDSLIEVIRPKFFGNGRTQEAIAPDNYQVKYHVDSPFVNGCQAGFMALGAFVLTGSGKMTNVPGTKIRATGNLRMEGRVIGATHEFFVSADNINSGSVSYTVSGAGMIAAPRRIEVAPSWNTTWWIDKASEGPDGFIVHFGTPAPSGNRLRIYAAVDI